MLELTESDVRAVANNRYWTGKRFLCFLGVIFGVLIAASVAMVLTDSAWATLAFVPVFGYLFYVMHDASKFQKEFLQQWRAASGVKSL